MILILKIGNQEMNILKNICWKQKVEFGTLIIEEEVKFANTTGNRIFFINIFNGILRITRNNENRDKLKILVLFLFNYKYYINNYGFLKNGEIAQDEKCFKQHW